MNEELAAGALENFDEYLAGEHRLFERVDGRVVRESFGRKLAAPENHALTIPT